MKRKRAARLSTVTSRRRRTNMKEIEERLSLLLLLLQHNLDKVFHHKRTR